jgi:hypothetical protein
MKSREALKLWLSLVADLKAADEKAAKLMALAIRMSREAVEEAAK